MPGPQNRIDATSPIAGRRPNRKPAGLFLFTFPGSHPLARFTGRDFAPKFVRGQASKLERTDPGNPLVLAAMGTRDLQAGRNEWLHICEVLWRLALKNRPTELAGALVELDRPAEARVVPQKQSVLIPSIPCYKEH
jgi:hypothetical protein